GRRGPEPYGFVTERGCTHRRPALQWGEPRTSCRPSPRVVTARRTSGCQGRHTPLAQHPTRPPRLLMASSLFVGNLPPDTRDEDLAYVFGHFGTVLYAHVATDRLTGLSRGLRLRGDGQRCREGCRAEQFSAGRHVPAGHAPITGAAEEADIIGCEQPSAR